MASVRLNCKVDYVESHIRLSLSLTWMVKNQVHREREVAFVRILLPTDPEVASGSQARSTQGSKQTANFRRRLRQELSFGWL